MADLKPRIERLVGRLVGGRGGGATPPAGRPPPALRPGDAGFGEAVARLVAMPLSQYAREGQLLEVHVPWLDVTLWLVPEERDVQALGREGVGRGRVWTARELIALMALPDRTPEIVQSLALAKRPVDGDIVEVRRRLRARAPESQTERADLLNSPVFGCVSGQGTASFTDEL